MISVVVYWAAGALALALASIRIHAWIATGLACGARRAELPVAARTALALLAGACLTMVIYAGLTAAGAIDAAILLDAAVAVGAIAWQGRSASGAARGTGRLLVPAGRFARGAFVAALVLLVIVAFGPPRDADVMHYHLAHIRQIVADGRWRQLPVCSYGIPFGWSLTYLPFERAGLPQAAHFLSLGAWLTTCAVCVEASDGIARQEERRAAGAAQWLLLCLTLLPVIMKAATTAMADAFMILVGALTVVLIAPGASLSRRGALALGFAAYIGFTTRYQAAAVAVAATCIVAFDAARSRQSRATLAPFVAGALLALAGAAPFVAANALTLGSAVWPFATASGSWTIGSAAARREYADIAQICAAAATAGGDWRARIAAAARLLSDRTVFPIPILLLVGSCVGFFSRRPQLRRAAVFALLFVGSWAIAQPALAPRFSIYLLPIAVLSMVPLLSSLVATRAAPVARAMSGAIVTLLAFVALIYARDYVVLAARGDVARFHRATWYWPAYDWANHHTARDARFAVILYGGHTYPLDRWNLSGDPGSSAAIPWSRLTTGSELMAFLESRRIDFVFYGPNVWTGQPMNDRIDKSIGAALAAGVLDTVRTFRTPIVYGRMAGGEKDVDIVLLAVKR